MDMENLGEIETQKMMHIFRDVFDNPIWTHWIKRVFLNCTELSFELSSTITPWALF